MPDLSQRRALVTGAAGFIGAYVVDGLAAAGYNVAALDAFDDTVYAASLKRQRAERLRQEHGVETLTLDLADVGAVVDLLDSAKPDVVIHLGALANPRRSVSAPRAYVESNIVATSNLLDAMRTAGVGKLVFASSSTVYGADRTFPWREDLPCDRPLAPYAATKRSAELLCHAYHVIAGLDVCVLRFFSAYGPWGRPDMMPMIVTRALFDGETFTLFDGGAPKRDFTYVGDIAAGVVSAAERVCGFETINLGRGEPIAMIDFVRTLESIVGKPALFDTKPLPPSEAPITYADIARARALLGYNPTVTLEDGLARLVDWYRAHGE